MQVENGLDESGQKSEIGKLVPYRRSGSEIGNTNMLVSFEP